MPLWSNVDEEAGKPKFLSDEDKAITLGISADETESQKATHAGWVISRVGTGGRAGRVINETIVAMGSMTGDNDTVDPDPVATIDTQPDNVTAAGGEDAVFTVVASTNRDPVTLTYQWQVSADGVSYTNISGATSNTLTIESGDPEYVDGNYIRVAVTPTGGAAVISDAAVLTVTA